MAMEAVISAGMTYQGSASPAEKKKESQSRVDTAETSAVSEFFADDTEKKQTKEIDKKAEGTSQNADPRNAQIRKAVDEVNKKVVNSEAIFGIHEATNRVTIKIVDKDSKKVLKEIPPEKTLDMIAKIWEQAGIMVDEKL